MFRFRQHRLYAGGEEFSQRANQSSRPRDDVRAVDLRGEAVVLLEESQLH